MQLPLMDQVFIAIRLLKYFLYIKGIGVFTGALMVRTEKYFLIEEM